MAKNSGDGLVWQDIATLRIEGMGWTDTEGPYERLPTAAKGVVRDDVWGLSLHSAGIRARFVTDASRIRARWTVRNGALASDHMPATGVSGLDLYTRHRGEWRWIGVGRPTESPTNEADLVAGLEATKREYILYLPLYNGVTKVEIGVPAGSTIRPAHPTLSRPPIVFYGTSIVQGGCASRPGMAYPALLGRWLGVPTINLGFSGNGCMEPEVGRFLAELQASAYVLDCLPNVEEPLVTERTAPLVRMLRAAHPAVPILLVEHFVPQDGYLIRSRRAGSARKNRAYQRAYQRLLREGVKGLRYVPAERLLGDDGEATVDGTHPTDLGFLRMARVLRPVLAQALRLPRKPGRS